VQILPSGQEPAGAGGCCLSLAPFRGVRYVEDRVSGLAEVTSPPYDVIAHDKEEHFLAADPHNVIRLILPRAEDALPGNPYHQVADELASWLADGILAPDPEPALYVYEQMSFPPPGQRVQRGLIGALGLVPLDAGVVWPHEGVAPGPIAGRRQLMEATQANLEPIFLLYHGSPDGAATRIVEEAAFTRQPLAEAVTTDGLRHRLWAITDHAELAAVAADLAARTAFIADGHHRYCAYLQLQARRRAAAGQDAAGHRAAGQDAAGHRAAGQDAAGEEPWDRGLALLVDAAAYPPRVGAIHRVVADLNPESAVMLAASGFKVRELPGGAAELEAALGELAAAGEHGVAFLLTGGERAYLLTDPDPALVEACIAADCLPLWRRLPAAVLRDVLLARLWGIGDDEPGVLAVHDAAAAVRLAAAPPGGTAVIGNPMRAADIYGLAARGHTVPRKSTSFGPKPRMGLVMRMFAQG